MFKFVLILIVSVAPILGGQCLATIIYIPGSTTTQTSLGWSSGSLTSTLKNTLDASYVIVPQTSRAHKTGSELRHHIRLSIIAQVLAKDPYTLQFKSTPYSKEVSNFGITIKDNQIVATDIDEYDDLDLIIDNALIRIGTGKQGVRFSQRDLQSLNPIYLWKYSSDLVALGYQVVSSRYRTNYDPAYRRHNIFTAFTFLGHIRVLNPGDSFSYLPEINYDEKAKKNYKNGLAIVQDEEIPVYGGGICGGSTATYQGLITNQGLKLDGRNHSKWFTNLYTATINGKKITTPGIDLTVYAGSTDLKVTNNSDHPLIIVSNYNGQYGGVEEVLSLGFASDQGSLTYVGGSTKYKKNKDGKSVKTGCFTWNINGKDKTSCYKEIW
ncbi:MAG TPA: VanW family protein [Candidatus Absconditabacterales bacterium]|nr:VanW family protein [Candidatus Absconditabacterales bacterium]